MKKKGLRILLVFLLLANGVVFAALLQGAPLGQKADPDPTPADLQQWKTYYCVNPNTAEQEVLMTLPGVGKALAARIIADRTQNGAYATVWELARVNGISETMILNWIDYLTVEE